MQTLVSGLFDLERREDRRPRALTSYLQDALYVLGLDAPLVLFVDPELARFCRTERDRLGFGDRTLVVARPLESLRAYGRLREIQRLPVFLNASAAKDTPLFQIFTYAKIDLLEEVMTQDPFNTEFFAWIDAGIAHVAVPPVTFPAPSDRIAVLEMCAVAPAEIADRRGFYDYERGRLAAGFIRGGRASVSELARAFRAELDEAIACGVRPNEQQVLSYLSASRPDLFAPYFGDYASILCNWDVIRRDVDTVLLNLGHCVRWGLTTHAREIGERLAASVGAGAIELTVDQRERWRAMGLRGASPLV